MFGESTAGSRHDEADNVARSHLLPQRSQPSRSDENPEGRGGKRTSGAEKVPALPGQRRFLEGAPLSADIRTARKETLLRILGSVSLFRSRSFASHQPLRVGVCPSRASSGIGISALSPSSRMGRFGSIRPTSFRISASTVSRWKVSATRLVRILVANGA
jgi:hypothetical protein